MDSQTSLKYTNILIEFLDPLTRIVDDHDAAEAFLLELGYITPGEVTAFDNLRGAVEGIFGIIDQIDKIIENEQNSNLPKLLTEILHTIKQLFTSITEFKNKIQSNFSGSDLLNKTDILLVITQKIIDYLFIKYLDRNNNTVYNAFMFLGLIDEEEIQEDEANFQSVYVKKTFNWNKILELLNNPVNSIKSNFLTSGEIHFEKLLYVLNEIGNSIGIQTDITEPEIELLDAFNKDDLSALTDYEELTVLKFPIYESEATQIILDIYPLIDKTTQAVNGIGMGIDFGGELEIDISDLLKLVLKYSSHLNNSLGFTLDDSGNFKFINNLFQNPQDILDKTEINVKISIVAGNQEEKAVSIGSEKGSRFELGTWKLSLGIDKKDKTDLYIEAEFRDGLLAILPSNPDGFIAKLLPEEGISSNFDLGLGFSSKNGLYFIGTSGLEIKIPSHFNLGIIEIKGLTFGVYFENDKIPITLGGSFAANLGPLNATVENIGIKLNTDIVNNNNGNLGPLDVSIGFKPPNGVGLAIDAGVVKGGGFLYFDYEKGEYGGAMELTFSDFLSLKAIGLIATKMPDGSKGFSLLIIITAEFTIQLGMGFVFLGAGGLLGLHRTSKLTPLAEGIRSGATANILFPQNVVENAPQIISDIKIFFPILQSHFLIGPMVKLGWGQPPLISIALGIIIEIKTDSGGSLERIAILGVLKCILPEEKSALLVLQVNFIGAIDFTKKTGFFFASVFESRVLFITIEGEMGLLVAWGNDPDFVVSVGGFHPRFNPPPLPFPVPKRVSLNILNESWGKIRVQGYFAVTTNTVQFGTKMELYFGFSKFKIEGHLAFDALFQFNPFYFIIEISGKVSLKVFGVDSFTISLKFTLEGTSPWRAKGYGKIKILFFSFKARFDKTWGNSKNTKLPPVEIIPILREELNEIQNWQSISPKSNQLLVTLRDLPEPEEGIPTSLTVHPVGTLRVSQRRIPLRIKLDKIGSQKPSDASKLDFEPTGAFETLKTHKENFARAQFQDMKDSKKLSSPSFEKEVGGLDLSVSGDQMRFGRVVVRHVRYELHTIDTAYKRFKKRFFSMLQILFVKFTGNNAASKSQLSFKIQKEYQPFDDRIEVLSGAYTVAFNRDNKPLNTDAMNFSSMASADEYISEILADDPNMADAIHAIPNNEVNHAA